MDVQARPGGGGWQPKADWSGPPASAASNGNGRAEAAAQRGSATWPALVEGQVRGIQHRSEPKGRKRTDQICTFRIERYDDLGNQIAVVPVEMRGRALVGALGEGDWVRAGGLGRDGNLRARRIENLTTGSVVRAKRHWVGLKALVVVTLLVVVALAALGFVSSAGTGDGGDGSGTEEPLPIVEPLPMP